MPEIIEAVRGTSVEVYVDGGIRHGSDVFKALALGARAVFLGRPIIYGLAYNVSIYIHATRFNADTLDIMIGRGWCQTSTFSDQQGSYDNNDIGWYVSFCSFYIYKVFV